MEQAGSLGVGLNHRNYFVRERLILKILGVSLSADESLGYKIYSYFVYSVFILAYPIIAAGDLFKHEFDVVAELFVYVVGTGLGSLITFVIFRQKERLGKFLNVLEKEPFTANPERGGDVEEELISRWHTFSNIQGLIFLAGSVMSVGSKVVYTFILRVRSSDNEDWRLAFGPLTVVNITYSPNFEITWFYQSTGVMCIGFSMYACTFILAGILGNISVQFKLLQNSLKRLVENCRKLMIQDKMYQLETSTDLDSSTIPWKYLKIGVRDAVQYHLRILQLVKEVEDIFGMLMLSIFLATLSLLCFEVYRSSLFPMNDPRLVVLFIEAASICFQALMICFYGEQVAQESEQVGSAAYKMNFVGSDLRFQEALIIIIWNSQDPVRIKAGKLIETSMVTFVWILRAAYSSFTMLRNVNNV